MWKSEYVGVYQLLNWKMHGETLKFIKVNIYVHPITGHEVPEGEWRYSSTLPLTSALDGVVGQPHASALYLWEGPGAHCIGSWVCLRAGQDWCGISRPHRDSIPGPSIPYRVRILCSYTKLCGLTQRCRHCQISF